VILAAHIDITSLAQGSTGGAAKTKTSDPLQQAFSESLSVASKASAQADAASEASTKATSRKKSSSEDSESNGTIGQIAPARSFIGSPLVVQTEQVVPLQQEQASIPDGVPPQLSLGNAVATTDTTAEVAAKTADVPPSVVQFSKDSSQIAQAASTAAVSASAASNALANQAVPLANASDQAAPLTDGNASTTMANQPASEKWTGDGLAGTSDAGISNFRLASTTEQSTEGNVSADASSDTVPSVGRDEIANPTQDSGQNAVLNAVSRAFRGTDPVPVLQPVHGASAGAASASAESNAAVVKRASDGLAGASDAGVSKDSAAEQSATANSVRDIAAHGVTNTASNVLSNELPIAAVNVSANASSDPAQVLQAVQGASAGIAPASAASNAPANQAIPLAIAPDQIVAFADANASISTANQPASAKRAGDGLAGASDAGVSKLVDATMAEQSAAANSVREAGAHGATNTVQNVSTNELPNAAAKLSGDPGSEDVPSAGVNDVSNPPQDSIPDAVLNAASYVFRGTYPVPVLQSTHDGSEGAAPTSAAKNALTNQAIPLANAPDQAVTLTDANASTTRANQIASVPRAGDGLAGASDAGVSNFSMASKAEQSATPAANGKTESKDTNKGSTSDAAGPKKHAEITADQSDTQTGAQRTTPSADQSQSAASSQGQNAVPIQMNYANHSAAAVVQAQVTASVSSMPGASQHAGVTSTAAKAPLTTASVPDTLPQTSPVINTARLINTMGQSEMRVGMRSDEFGNISISTTASKDAITAQISLDHGELAKIISAQLPEMQAKLGSNQTVNVRIDMNSTGAGQGADTSRGMTNSSYDQSRGGGQQSSYAASSYASNNIVESQLSPVVATATTGYGSVNSRLDIRI
jgi:hypothetical protein